MNRKCNWSEQEDKVIIDYVLKRSNTSRNGRIKDMKALASLLPDRNVRRLCNRVFSLRKHNKLPKPGKMYREKVKMFGYPSKRGHIPFQDTSRKYAKWDVKVSDTPIVSRGTFEAYVIGICIALGILLIGVSMLINAIK